MLIGELAGGTCIYYYDYKDDFNPFEVSVECVKGLRWLSHLATISHTPFYVLVPADVTYLTLIPSQLNATTDILSEASVPARLTNCAVDSLELVPALLRCDLGQVSGGIRLADRTARRE